MAVATPVANEQVLVENTSACVRQIQIAVPNQVVIEDGKKKEIVPPSDVINLPPGVSAVPGEIWAQAEKSKLVQEWLARGFLKVQEGKEGLIGSLSDCEPIKACQIVYNTLSLQTLRGWQVQETRKGVLDAISEQIVKLTTPGSEVQK